MATFRQPSNTDGKVFSNAKPVVTTWDQVLNQGGKSSSSGGKKAADKAAADAAAKAKAEADAKAAAAKAAAAQAKLTAQGAAGKPINAGFFDPYAPVKTDPNSGALDYNWSPGAAASTYNWLFGGLPGIADASSGGKPVGGTLEDFILGRAASATPGSTSAPQAPQAPQQSPWVSSSNYQIRRN